MCHTECTQTNFLRDAIVVIRLEIYGNVMLSGSLSAEAPGLGAGEWWSGVDVTIRELLYLSQRLFHFTKVVNQRAFRTHHGR